MHIFGFFPNSARIAEGLSFLNKMNIRFSNNLRVSPSSYRTALPLLFVYVLQIKLDTASTSRKKIKVTRIGTWYATKILSFHAFLCV